MSDSFRRTIASVEEFIWEKLILEGFHEILCGGLVLDSLADKLEGNKLPMNESERWDIRMQDMSGANPITLTSDASNKQIFHTEPRSTAEKSKKTSSGSDKLLEFNTINVAAHRFHMNESQDPQHQ